MSADLATPTAKGPSWKPTGSILERIPSVVLVGGAVLLLLAIWEIVVRMGWVSEFVLPRASDTLQALWEVCKDLVTGGNVRDNYWVTLKESLIGLFLAGAIGFIVGVVIAETVIGQRVVQPFMVALYAAPKVALAPVFVAWFGFGLTPKVVMAVTIAFFPVMVDTAAGLGGVDEDADKLFATLRASRFQRFMKLKLPNALPFIFAGLKSAAVLSLIGALVAEFSGGGRGIGSLIQTASLRFNLDVVFAYVILLSVTAFAIYWLIDRIERSVVFWRRSGFIPTES